MRFYSILFVPTPESPTFGLPAICRSYVLTDSLLLLEERKLILTSVPSPEGYEKIQRAAKAPARSPTISASCVRQAPCGSPIPMPLSRI
ncbi:hypothetical protein KCP74_12825 [Salmonella enterica subsp. enterica]|nr:hypothetical protein KCP74_12825 [Salmonella enterica subsp. enterica]